MYSRPSMSFLLMTLHAKYSPVLMWTASLTMAYVPLPSVLPVRYYAFVGLSISRLRVR